MNSQERRDKMAEADSFGEVLAYACGEPLEEKKYLIGWVDEVEGFLEDRGYNRAQPRKMAVIYVLLRHDHSIRSIVKWWGNTESSYWSLSADSAKKYAKELEEIVESHDEAEDGAGFGVYEPSEDPLGEFYDVEVSSRNTGLDEFT